LRELEDRSLLSVSPVGIEFRVNTHTQGVQQTTPQAPQAVAMNPTTGDYVAVWSSQGQISGGDWDVYFQRYNAAGVAQGPETLVNTHINGANQLYASVAMNGSGNFVVTWSGNQAGHWNIYAQRFNSSGVAQGSIFQVSTSLLADQEYSTVAMDQSGNFVIAWSGHQLGNWNAYAQAFNASGAPTSSVFGINTPILGQDQFLDDLAMNASGSFVVSWSGHQSGRWAVYGQRYNASDSPVGSTFQVSTNTTDDQESSTVAMDAPGDFIVTWSGHQSGRWNIYAQTYNAGGTPISSNFQVNPSTNQDQELSTVAYGNTANPIVTWSSNNQDGNGWGIYAQQVSPSGTLVGSELQVNTYTQNNQLYSSIAGDNNGNLVVIWSSNNQDGNNFGVYGQRFTTGVSSAGILVGPTNLSTSETGSTASFSVSLLSSPTAPVLLTLGNSDPSQGSLSQSSLTFTSSNWNVPQAVTVTGLDDHIVHGNQTYQITGSATSSDTNYNNLAMTPVVVTNSEADVAGFNVTPTSLTTSETGTSASFTVALTSEPMAPVTITLNNGNPSEGSLSQSSLTFNTTNWNTPQTITVTGLDDHIVHGDQSYQITGTATSSDSIYNNLALAPVTVTNTEADAAGFTVTPTSIQTSMAGASASFTVTLTSQPVAPVTITLSSTNPGEGALSQPALVFTAANWNVAQTESVTGQNDPLATGNVTYQINGTASGADGNYNNLAMTPVSVTNVDTNLPGFIVTPSTLTTSERGTSDSFSLALTTLPLGTVTVALVDGNPSQGSLSTTSLTFSTLDWNVPQTVTVTGLDDHVVNGDQIYQITGTASSLLDLGYNGLSMTPVTVTNTEADVAGITVTPTSLTTSETGTSAAFTIALKSQPTAPVTISLTNANPSEGSLSTTAIGFDATNWNVAQTVTVTGLDDGIVHGDQTYQIIGSATSTDANYNRQPMTPVTLTNTEADVPGFTVGPTSLTTSESGTTASFTIVLTSKPLAPVTVSMQPTDASQGSLSRAALTFDATNWNVAQTVTVTGLDSYMTTPSQTYQITSSASSADASYNNINLTPVTVTNTETPNPSSTRIVSLTNPTVYGQAVTITATVVGVPPMTGTPTGTVTFMDGTTTLLTTVLNGGAASFTTSAFSPGAHHITVNYGGDAYFAAGASNAFVAIVAPATAATPAAPISSTSVPATVLGLLATAPAASPDSASQTSQSGAPTTSATAGALKLSASAHSTPTVDTPSTSTGGAPAQLQLMSANRGSQLFAPVPRAAWQDAARAEVVAWMPGDDESRFETLQFSSLTSSFAARRTAVEQGDIFLDTLLDTGDIVRGADGPRETTAMVGTGVIAAAGYALLNTRLGLWLLSLLSSQPLWKQFDPLEVLYAWEDNSEEPGPEDTETLVNLVDEW
jgi:hypothetical protein